MKMAILQRGSVALVVYHLWPLMTYSLPSRTIEDRMLVASLLGTQGEDTAILGKWLGIWVDDKRQRVNMLDRHLALLKDRLQSHTQRITANHSCLIKTAFFSHVELKPAFTQRHKDLTMLHRTDNKAIATFFQGPLDHPEMVDEERMDQAQIIIVCAAHFHLGWATQWQELPIKARFGKVSAAKYPYFCTDAANVPCLQHRESGWGCDAVFLSHSDGTKMTAFLTPVGGTTVDELLQRDRLMVVAKALFGGAKSGNTRVVLPGFQIDHKVDAKQLLPKSEFMGAAFFNTEHSYLGRHEPPCMLSHMELHTTFLFEPTGTIANTACDNPDVLMFENPFVVLTVHVQQTAAGESVNPPNMHILFAGKVEADALDRFLDPSIV